VSPDQPRPTRFRATLDSIHASVPEAVTVQHIVVDAGSTDRTVAVAREFDCDLIIGEDEGIYDAMNIGLRRADGDVIAMLNSDDTYLEGALETVRDWYEGRKSSWMVAGLRWIDEDGRRIADLPAPPSWLTVEAFASLGWNCIHHQTSFLTRKFYQQVGEYDLAFLLAADYDLLARALRLAPFDRIDRTLATFRRHGHSASMQGAERGIEEGSRIAKLYGPPSKSVRLAYRWALKSWLNAASPGWFLAKRRGSA